MLKGNIIVFLYSWKLLFCLCCQRYGGRVTNDNSYQLAPNNFSNGLPQLKQKKGEKARHTMLLTGGFSGEI
jgi:hypothetical protein